MLGLKHDQNVLADYDPLWESAFSDEKDPDGKMSPFNQGTAR
jgi:hypothetical protein